MIDTSVLIAAFRSQRGAAYRLLLLTASDLFQTNLSVPLVAEYEAVAKRMLNEIPLTEQDIDDILDYLCTISNRQRIFFLWRPFLPDPGDDMVLELAVAASCNHIVIPILIDNCGCGIDGVTVGRGLKSPL
ncbi:MAG: PIN domain-containing protein, partial [Anaerolineales bacterium]|nr:PIN domain-containing protein [Anaerolineales bacterium]